MGRIFAKIIIISQRSKKQPPYGGCQIRSVASYQYEQYHLAKKNHPLLEGG